MKLSWISKFKKPVQTTPEPDERYLSDCVAYFNRRTRVVNALLLAGVAGVLGTGLPIAHLVGVDSESFSRGSAILYGFSTALGFLLSCKDEADKHRPLESLGEAIQAEAMLLIRSVPEARRLSERARESGRSLRVFDLDAMREFQKQRDAKRLNRESRRLQRAPSSADGGD